MVTMMLLAVADAAVAQSNVHSLAAQSNNLENTHTTAADAAAGAKVFRAHCATCHGRSAQGFRGPNLTRGAFRHGGSDDQLFRHILQGIPGTSMPGVYLPDRQVWQTISYLRSLTPAYDSAPVTGDVARGKRLFTETAGCMTCHRVDGEGGRRGTDLSAVGWRLSVEHLRESLLHPSETVSRRFRLVRLSTLNGGQLEGILLNEDSYSIQFMDENERLVSVAKSDLRDVQKPAESLMPTYGQALTRQQLDDIVAYLHSLNGDTPNE